MQSEEDEVCEARIAKLGFRPQKEIVYNKLLPYADQLDEESVALFRDIKTNLVKAFLAREIRPGCALWTSRLHRYMKIYGFKFSKEDHICLIKLFFELMTIPNLEPTRVNKFAGTLAFLLKKKHLLSRDDLQLDWKPLYELYNKITKKTSGGLSMYRFFQVLECTVNNLIRASKVYFPVTATQEILNELRPKLCPFSSKAATGAVVSLELFLPCIMKPEEAPLGYQLWFEEFMTFWNTCHNSCIWENQFACLMADLASHNIGRIDWEPYVPMMFTRFIRTLGLPVYYRQKQANKLFRIEVNAMALWIVSVIGGESKTVFKHLESLMQTLESYYNSANAGRWTPKLREFLRKLAVHFVNRVHDERYRKYTWETQTPNEFKLTENDIDTFVTILKPCVDHLIYSRHNQDMSFTFNYLACLRPKLVIPMVLDKLYETMDSLTEPHKLTSAMLCVTAVSRYMVQGKTVGYPEGPTHVIPLLINLLPGIDPNDRRKCFMTFNFIVQFIYMIPLINSSDAFKYYDDLTEEEHTVCEATTGFEDFVLQLFDRLCTWVESNSLENTRLEENDTDRKKTKAESMAENALVSVITAVLTQSSPEIFTAALKKVYNFVTTRIFEIKVSGKLMGIICQSFSKINPKETAKLFVPYFCDRLNELLSENDALKEEHPSEEILYNLLILSEVVDCNTEILPFLDRITLILDKVLYMTSTEGNQLGSHMLNLLMITLTFTIPKEYRSCTESYDTPLKDYLSIRDWGKAGNIHQLKIEWFMPGEKEIEGVQKLLNRYLVPELDKLTLYSKGEVGLTRQDLRRTFRIILASLGCHVVLPLWNEPAINLMDSVLDPWAFELIIGSTYSVVMPDGSNVRKKVADVMHQVQKKILTDDEGDTKSIYSIIYIYDVLLFNKFRGRDFEFHWKNFYTVKALLEDRLHRNKQHLRHILIDRVMLHQEFRNESRSCSFTQTHMQIMLDLFELSTSRYSEIRICAQRKLFSAISTFPYSYTILMPYIKEILTMDSTENHDQFKGCLHILLGPKAMPLIARHDWNFIGEIWPLLVKSKPSEKLSIINLIDLLMETVHKFFPTIAINLVIPDRALHVGYKLTENYPQVDLQNFQGAIGKGTEKLQENCCKFLDTYNQLIEQLLDAATNGNLHWRYHTMAVCLLRDLVHPDVKYNADVVRFFLKASINDSLKIRKIALKVLLYILMQHKLKYQKIAIDPFQFSNANAEKPMSLKPGIRPDNEWLLYNSKNIPKSSEEWKEKRFVHLDYVGYYCWPKEVNVYDYSAPHLIDVDKMNAQQAEIYNFFCDKNNVEALVKFNALEEKKGKDKFNAYRLMFFKNLFKMFDNKLLHQFLPHLDTLISDEQEQSQRCAAEVICGIISGCKHWEYEQTVEMWTEIIPLVRRAFNCLSEESLNDWTVGLSKALENRDPNRHSLLLEFFMDDPLNEPTSFVGCSRLCILHCCLAAQPWRNAELYSRCLDYFNSNLTHPFQNVRDKIATGLSGVFGKDIIFKENGSNHVCRASEFFKSVQPQLKELYITSLKRLEEKSSVVEMADDLKEISLKEDEKRDGLIRLFKVVAKYVTNSIVRANYSAISEHFSLLPLTCLLQTNESDDELQTICTHLIAVMGNMMTLEKYMADALNAIREVANCPFWSARAVIAEFIPVYVFHNMPVIIDTSLGQDILDITLKLLEDVQPEVRVKASHVISSFLHVNFIKEPMQLLELFRKKANTKVKHKHTEPKNSQSLIRIRHAGVLGLCSYINSRPYDVPDYLPAIFQDLGSHLNDPQPIPSTIRKTLGDFRRTHHSNWEVHKLKFTEDELSVLSDLTVPPSYYA